MFHHHRRTWRQVFASIEGALSKPEIVTQGQGRVARPTDVSGGRSGMDANRHRAKETVRLDTSPRAGIALEHRRSTYIGALTHTKGPLDRRLRRSRAGRYRVSSSRFARVSRCPVGDGTNHRKHQRTREQCSTSTNHPANCRTFGKGRRIRVRRFRPESPTGSGAPGAYGRPGD
jgi:hypothetical protein